MAEPIELRAAPASQKLSSRAADASAADRIAAALASLDYGSVVVTVHDGKIVQIDTTRRERFAC